MSDKATDKRPQFFLIEDAVVTDFDLDPYTGWLYVVIVKHADRKTGDAFPGIARLSKLCKMSRSQVMRSIKALEEKHLIEVKRDTKPFKGEKRQREVNHYQVLSAAGSVYQELGVVSASDYPSTGQELGVVSGVDRNKNQSKQESVKPKKVRAPKVVKPLHTEKAQTIIDAWGRARGFAALDLGAPIGSDDDWKFAEEMAQWERPPTDDEIKLCIKNSNAYNYPVRFLKKDVVDLRAKNAKKIINHNPELSQPVEFVPILLQHARKEDAS